MGKVPVVWSTGRSLPAMMRLPPLTVTEKWASGQDTAPRTYVLVSESHVLVAVSIQGPTTDAPTPDDGKFVTQESTKPTLGVDDTCPSPRGMAAGLIGPGDVTVVAYLVTLERPEVDDVDTVELLEPHADAIPTRSTTVTDTAAARPLRGPTRPPREAATPRCEPRPICGDLSGLVTK